MDNEDFNATRLFGDNLGLITTNTTEIPKPKVSKHTTNLDLSNLNLTALPTWLPRFKKLKSLNLSKNNLTLSNQDFEILIQISENLEILNLNSNEISDQGIHYNKFASTFFNNSCPNLKNLDLSSNFITQIDQICKCKSLVKLQLSGNELTEISPLVKNLKNLQLLYLGFNKLADLTGPLIEIVNLKTLALNNNKIEHITDQVGCLTNLECLHLHNNKILTLPRVLVDGLTKLKELSLRNNPLIDKFVRQRIFTGIKHAPPTLFELACRSIKQNNIQYSSNQISPKIHSYLEHAHKCPNPNCSGIYFDSSYAQIKFVDTCGAYRLPLLQYLCSPKCFERSEPVTSSFETESSEGDEDEVDYMTRRVTLSNI